MTDGEIYAKYKDGLIRYATALVGPDDAADVLSAVVVRVLRKRKQYRIILSVKWLYHRYTLQQRSSNAPATLEAARLLGDRVRLARRERRWTIVELAERVGVSPVTIRKVEKGDPSVALGTAFEAATLVGVALFHEDADRRALEAEVVVARLAVLPSAVRKAAGDDDF